MFIICHYGCGQEAAHQLKNGKWCCKKSVNQCPKQREKINNTLREKIWNNPDYKQKQSNSLKKYFQLESIEEKIQRSEKIKETIKKNNSIEIMREKAIKRNKNLEYKKNLSDKATERMKDQSRRKKLSNIFRFTIDTIKQKYPFFLDVEEIRYNPENIDKKEIQARCKNSNCKNSKEKNGWFTPTHYQISTRIFVLKHSRGNSFFFCSNECKKECGIFRKRYDPDSLSNFRKYHKKVSIETYKSIKEYKNKIQGLNLRGKLNGYDLDHKYSISEGFKNNIDPKIIGHWKNLEILKAGINRYTKKEKSSITIEDLLMEIENI